MKKKHLDTENPWRISVIRDDVSTIIEELGEGSPKRWSSLIRVEFIGEDGVDLGGLLRELYTMLFRNTQLFEDEHFSISSTALHNGHYKLLGKCVAYALICGHPGPQRLNPLFTDFLLKEEIPQLHIEKVDAKIDSLIEEVCTEFKHR